MKANDLVEVFDSVPSATAWLARQAIARQAETKENHATVMCIHTCDSLTECSHLLARPLAFTQRASKVGESGKSRECR